MDKIALATFYVVVFPGLVFTGSLGLFFSWVNRKITARIQSRMGPPWYQCYADVLKLIGKVMILPAGSRKTGFLVAPSVGLAGITLLSTIIWRVNIDPDTTFIGDLIVVLYLLILPSLALIIGGSSSRNPFGAVGTSREIKMVLAYELPFLMAIVTVILKIKSILLGDIITFQSINGVMLRYPSCIIACIVCLPCIQAKLGYTPFDISEAETEIIGGPIAEYSGGALAQYKLTNAMMLLMLPLLLITLFFGGIHLNGLGILTALIEYLVILAFITVIKSTWPRLRIDQAVRFFWFYVTPFAALGIILALLGV